MVVLGPLASPRPGAQVGYAADRLGTRSWTETIGKEPAMHSIQTMLETHPQATENDALRNCVEQCFACAATCTSCADACLAEESVGELAACIRLNLDCADICVSTGKVVARQTATHTALLSSALQACREACRACAEECTRHAEHHEHCRLCAEECRRCQQACEEALSAVPVA